jgi:glycosyltransferase involved in cell wall biosynthesis
MQPIVTIVVPCYNAEKWIWDCLASIIKQDLDEIEIIVVDDASTDRSLEVINNFNKLFGGIKVIRNVVNRGECKTSASGFAEAEGKYICRLSADDMFVSVHHLSRQIEEMEKYNLDWCYNSKSLVGESIETAVLSQTSWILIPIRHSSALLHALDNYCLKCYNICYLLLLFSGNPINSSAMMIRSESYRHASWDSGLRTHCDMMLIGQMFLSGFKVRSLDTVGSFYRIHTDQSTNTLVAKNDFVTAKMIMRNEVLLNNYDWWMKICIKMGEV